MKQYTHAQIKSDKAGMGLIKAPFVDLSVMGIADFVDAMVRPFHTVVFIVSYLPQSNWLLEAWPGQIQTKKMCQMERRRILDRMFRQVGFWFFNIISVFRFVYVYVYVFRGFLLIKRQTNACAVVAAYKWARLSLNLLLISIAALKLGKYTSMYNGNM